MELLFEEDGLAGQNVTLMLCKDAASFTMSQAPGSYWVLWLGCDLVCSERGEPKEQIDQGCDSLIFHIWLFFHAPLHVGTHVTQLRTLMCGSVEKVSVKMCSAYAPSSATLVLRLSTAAQPRHVNPYSKLQLRYSLKGFWSQNIDNYRCSRGRVITAAKVDCLVPPPKEKKNLGGKEWYSRKKC